MTPDALLLIAIGGLIALLAQSGILYAAVGMAGGGYVEERNSYPTAFFVTIIQGVIGLAMRFLVLEGSLDRISAIAIIFAASFLVTMLVFRLGPLRALLVMLVASLLATIVGFSLSFFARLLGIVSNLGGTFSAA